MDGMEVKGAGLLGFLPHGGLVVGTAHCIGLVPQVGGAVLTCCGSIVRIPGVQLNPQLESDCMGIPGSVTYNTTGRACEDLLAFH